MGRPKNNTGETPKHSIRADDTLWKDAKAEAKAEGRTITDVIVSALTRYVTDRRARRQAQRPIPINADTAALIRNLTQDHVAGGSVFKRQVQLRTFLTPEADLVMFDSAEVSHMLRELATSYRGPLHAALREDLTQLADQLDVEALVARDKFRQGEPGEN